MLTVGAALLVLPALVRGHAYIYYPPMRGGAVGNSQNGYCPQCFGSTDLPMPTCGKTSFLDVSPGPITEFTAGQRVKFEIRVTAHHKGHFQFRLCDRTINGSLRYADKSGYAGEEACLSEHILERVRPEEMHSNCKANDMRGDCQPFDEANPSYWYLPPASAGDTVEDEPADHPSLAQAESRSSRAGAIYKFHYRLPEGVTCEKCTLQWWWMSANSCTPHEDAYKCYFGASGKMQQQGWDVSEWCSGACSYAGDCPAVQDPPRSPGCGEEFKNCADVRIVQGGSTQSTTQGSSTQTTTQAESTTQTQVTTQPPADTTPEPESEPEPEEEECTAIPDAFINSGATQQAATDERCQSCAVGDRHKFWPCELLCTCSTGSSQTTGTTTRTTTHATTRTTTQAPGMVCTATPGLNRGVTDESCEQCTRGYEHWPCNEAILCTCTPSLIGTGRKAQAREHHFLGLIQQSDDVQKGAFGAEAGGEEEEL